MTISPRCSSEIDEQVEFLAGHGHLAPALEHLPCLDLDADDAKGQGLRLAPRTWPTQHRVDARHQLAHGEGLGDVVIGAQLQSPHAVGLLRACGEHDHGNVDATAAQLMAHVPAAHTGHHDVEQDQIRRLAARQVQARLCIGGGKGLEALEAKIVLDASHDLGLVVHDQDSRHDALNVPWSARATTE